MSFKYFLEKLLGTGLAEQCFAELESETDRLGRGISPGVETFLTKLRSQPRIIEKYIEQANLTLAEIVEFLESYYILMCERSRSNEPDENPLDAINHTLRKEIVVMFATKYALDHDVEDFFEDLRSKIADIVKK